MIKRIFSPLEALKVIAELASCLSALDFGKRYALEIKEYHEKRSVDANAYAWVFIAKLAEALTAEAGGDTAYDKDEIYLMMLKRYGQGGIAKIRQQDAEKFCKAWKYHELHETLSDESAAYYRFWVGSSNYDTKEMSLFIDGIIAECRNMGIETITPQEKERLMQSWQAK